jgi:hypothetical protein
LRSSEARASRTPSGRRSKRSAVLGLGSWRHLASVWTANCRRIVGWALADRLRAALVDDALGMANRAPPSVQSLQRNTVARTG